MSWYTVTKKVKGRSYLYRQRSFRVNGKVRTESQYLGPVDGGSGAACQPTAEEKEPTAELFITTTPEPTLMEPTLRIQKAIRQRTDISDQALIREETMVRERMEKHGLPTDDLKPIRVWEGRRVGRRNKRSGHFVFAAPGGQRNAFKREYRQAIADRWLRHTQQHDPALYAYLRTSMDEKQRRARSALTSIILLSGTAHKYRAYLWFAWTGKLPSDLSTKAKADKIGVIGDEAGNWRQEAVKLTAEIIQHGGDKVWRKYEKRTQTAMARWEIEYDKYQRMGWGDYLNGNARRQLKRVEKAGKWWDACQAAQDKAEIMAGWYENAMA